MIKNVIWIIAFVLIGLAGCTNFSKIYNSGSLKSSDFYSEVGFETRLNLIILPVQIRGETYRFLFDTGAPNVISKELSEKLQLKTIASGNVGDSQGKKNKLGVVKIDTIGVGGVYFQNTAAVVADLNEAEIACLEIDGILGANLMRFAYWKIDSENKVLTLSSDLDTLITELQECYTLPFKPVTTYTPRVSMALNDTLIESITYDTGFGGYLSLSKSVDLDPKFQLAEYFGYGSAGLYGTQIDTLRYGRIGIDVDGFNQVGIAEYNNLSDKKLVGMEFLNQFVQILDWQSNEISLYTNTVIPQVYSSFPLSPRWVDGKLIVGGLKNDSSLISLGLNIGDTIEVLNGVSFRGADFITYCDLIIASRENKPDTLSLELSNGKKHDFIRINVSVE